MDICGEEAQRWASSELLKCMWFGGIYEENKTTCGSAFGCARDSGGLEDRNG